MHFIYLKNRFVLLSNQHGLFAFRMCCRIDLSKKKNRFFFAIKPKLSKPFEKHFSTHHINKHVSNAMNFIVVVHSPIRGNPWYTPIMWDAMHTCPHKIVLFNKNINKNMSRNNEKRKHSSRSYNGSHICSAVRSIFLLFVFV